MLLYINPWLFENVPMKTPKSAPLIPSSQQRMHDAWSRTLVTSTSTQSRSKHCGPAVATKCRMLLSLLSIVQPILGLAFAFCFGSCCHRSANGGPAPPCKACGGTDHQRSSSMKCSKYKKKQRSRCDEVVPTNKRDQPRGRGSSSQASRSGRGGPRGQARRLKREPDVPL